MIRLEDSLYEFPWNNDIEIQKAYKLNNYRIEITHSASNKAIIFFTSNDLYFPNTVECMRRSIYNDDRYEWENISKHKLVQNEYKKIIYVRDVYKQWYITGINEVLSSIDEVIRFLKKETEGYEVVTCGSSSGGYMAVVAGALLDAKKIVCNSGQFNINEVSVFAKEFIDDAVRNKYFDISDLVKHKVKEAYYFIPGKADSDLYQLSFINDICIKKIIFDSKIHGVTVESGCYPYILVMDNGTLDLLFNKYKDSIISAKDFSKALLSGKEYYKNRMISIAKKIKRILLKCRDVKFSDRF